MSSDTDHTLPDESPLQRDHGELSEFFAALAEEYPDALASDLTGALSQAAQEVGTTASRDALLEAARKSLKENILPHPRPGFLCIAFPRLPMRTRLADEK